jgi:hypothetical protein
MNRKFLLKILPSLTAISIGLFLFVYQVVLSDIDLPAEEDILEVKGKLGSYIEKNDGLLIKLNEFDDVFYFSHRAGNLSNVSNSLSNLKGVEIKISTKSNGAYVPFSSDERYRLVFAISSGGSSIISYEETSRSWELKSRKNEGALIALLFILYGLYSIWKLRVNLNDKAN